MSDHTKSASNSVSTPAIFPRTGQAEQQQSRNKDGGQAPTKNSYPVAWPQQTWKPANGLKLSAKKSLENAANCKLSEHNWTDTLIYTAILQWAH